MSERHALRQFGKIAQKWRDLAERRRDYFLELYRSGRWKHYYSEAEFTLCMKEVMDVTEAWGRIAPTLAEAQKLAARSESASEADQTRGTDPSRPARRIA